MGHPNHGLVSQQDKRQPSFPPDCPFQATTHCEAVHVSPGAGCLLLQPRAGKSRHAGQRGFGRGDLCQKPKETPGAGLGGEGSGITTKRSMGSSGPDTNVRLSAQFSRQTRKNPFTDPTAKAHPRVRLWRTTG